MDSASRGQSIERDRRISRREKIGFVISGTRQSIFALLLVSVLCASLPAAASTADDEKAGAVLFRDKGCAFCHGTGGVGGKKGPSLADLRKNKAWPPEKIKDQILNGGQKMPPFADSVTDQEVAQLVAYLRAKKKPVPPPAATPAPQPPQ